MNKVIEAIPLETTNEDLLAHRMKRVLVVFETDNGERHSVYPLISEEMLDEPEIDRFYQKMVDKWVGANLQ